MRMTAKAEYACLAMIELAKRGENGPPKRVRDIAEARGIPNHYLVQILLRLKTAGLVQSARGAEGGYHLTRRAEDISVGDVIDAIDGPKGRPRPATPGRPRPATVNLAPELADLFERAREAQRHVLASTNIAQLTFSDPAAGFAL
jgi:Rrf2 family transcriptional regulator, cysteine metabolism repressor